MEIFPVCINCKNLIEGNKCKAFKIIPNDIWSRGETHFKPLPQQKNKIVFEPIEKK